MDFGRILMDFQFWIWNAQHSGWIWILWYSCFSSCPLRGPLICGLLSRVEYTDEELAEQASLIFSIVPVNLLMSFLLRLVIAAWFCELVVSWVKLLSLPFVPSFLSRVCLNVALKLRNVSNSLFVIVRCGRRFLFNCSHYRKFLIFNNTFCTVYKF